MSGEKGSEEPDFHLWAFLKRMIQCGEKGYGRNYMGIYGVGDKLVVFKACTVE